MCFISNDRWKPGSDYSPENGLGWDRVGLGLGLGLGYFMGIGMGMGMGSLTDYCMKSDQGMGSMAMGWGWRFFWCWSDVGGLHSTVAYKYFWVYFYAIIPLYSNF